MSSQQAFTVLNYLLGIVRIPGLEELSDKGLLRRFVGDGCENAFAEVVRRHGPLVLNRCRVLRNNHADAEDLFQAVFLVLARKAASVEEESVVGWLYTVTEHLASREAGKEARRKAHQKNYQEEIWDMADKNNPVPDIDLRELKNVLTEEIAALPDGLKEVILLCDMEGRMREEVAAQIGMSERTVHYRLAKARSLLRERLDRRGITIGVAMLVTALSQQTASAAVTASMIGSLSRAAAVFAGLRRAASQPHPQAAALAEAFLRSGISRKWIWLLVMTVATTGTAGGIGYYARVSSPTSPTSLAAPVTPPSSPSPASPRLEGKDMSPTRSAAEVRAMRNANLMAVTAAILGLVEQLCPGSRAELLSASLEGGEATVLLQWTVAPMVALLSPAFEAKFRYVIERRELIFEYRQKGEAAWTAKDLDRPIYATLGDKGPEWFVRGRSEFQIVRKVFDLLHDMPLDPGSGMSSQSK